MRDKRNLLHGDEARSYLLKGITKLAAAVKVTLGAEGKHVVIEDKDYPYPIVTRDGVAVAESITFGDNRIEQGARMAKEAARETYHTAGDGTTSTIIITEALCVSVEAYLKAGKKPNCVAKGIRQAAKDAAGAIAKIAIPVTEQDLVDVAVVSANNDEEMGKLVADTVWKVGENGAVVYKPTKNPTKVEIVQGTILKAGLPSPEYANMGRSATYSEPVIYVTDFILSKGQDVVNILEKHVERFGKASPIIIIAKEVIGEARSGLGYVYSNQKIPLCFIEAPYDGEQQKMILRDVATAIGATFLSESKGYAVKNIYDKDTSYYGKCKRIDIFDEETRFIEGNGDPKEVADIEQEIKKQIEESDNQELITLLKDRIAWLTGKVAIVSVFGTTPMETTTKVHRLDDSVKSSQAALAEGMVIGGGAAYLYAYCHLLEQIDKWDTEECDGDFYAGYEAMTEALLAPSIQILYNAGMDFSEIDGLQDELIAEIKEGKLCTYNVISQAVESMADTHIFDSAKVVKTAISKASSVGAVFSTTEVLNYDEFKFVSNKREDWFGN